MKFLSNVAILLLLVFLMALSVYPKNNVPESIQHDPGNNLAQHTNYPKIIRRTFDFVGMP